MALDYPCRSLRGVTQLVQRMATPDPTEHIGKTDCNRDFVSKRWGPPHRLIL